MRRVHWDGPRDALDMLLELSDVKRLLLLRPPLSKFLLLLDIPFLCSDIDTKKLPQRNLFAPLKNHVWQNYLGIGGTLMQKFFTKFTVLFEPYHQHHCLWHEGIREAREWRVESLDVKYRNLRSMMHAMYTNLLTHGKHTPHTLDMATRVTSSKASP